MSDGRTLLPNDRTPCAHGSDKKRCVVQCTNHEKCVMRCTDAEMLPQCIIGGWGCRLVIAGGCARGCALCKGGGNTKPRSRLQPVVQPVGHCLAARIIMQRDASQGTNYCRMQGKGTPPLPKWMFFGAEQ